MLSTTQGPISNQTALEKLAHDIKNGRRGCAELVNYHKDGHAFQHKLQVILGITSLPRVFLSFLQIKITAHYLLVAGGTFPAFPSAQLCLFSLQVSPLIGKTGEVEYFLGVLKHVE